MAKSVWLTCLLMTLVAAGGCKHRSFRSSTATQSEGEGEGEPREAGNLQPEFSGALALTMNLEILTLVLPKQAELEDFVSLLVDDNRTDGKGLKFRGLVLTHRDFSKSENRESIELNFKLLSLEKYKEKVRFIKIDTETPLNWSRDWVPLFFRSTDKWFSVEPA